MFFQEKKTVILYFKIWIHQNETELERKCFCQVGDISNLFRKNAGRFRQVATMCCATGESIRMRSSLF
jgi:hypothetical protein